jgi:hypothetical protein
MKKLNLSYYFLLIVCLNLFSCTKNKLTPDGKPISDGPNNIVRVDVNANSYYDLSIAETNNNTNNIQFQFIKDSLIKSFEYAFKGLIGEELFIEVWSPGGTIASCDIYFKGLKVPLSQQAIDSFQGGPPSHINVTYKIGD